MLTLAIYRNDGQIERLHELESGKDYTDAIKVYERKNIDSGYSVEVREFEDESIEAYLYRMKALKKKTSETNYMKSVST